MLIVSRDEKHIYQSQEKGRTMGQALDMVNKFMQSQDTTFLADDFRFIGPVDQTTGIEAFMKLNESFFPQVTGMRMLKQFEHGNDVCSIYEMDLKSPSGTSLTLNVADWVVVKNGKMEEERIYYDAREFAAAFGR
jgi:hypothetical protein